MCSAESTCPSISVNKRSLNEQLRLAQRLCPIGKEACGGYKGPRSYECIDTSTTLDSCRILACSAHMKALLTQLTGGGCVFPLFGGNSTGRDCSVIPEAEITRCQESKCSVTACATGWNVSDDGESCIPHLESLD